MTDHSALIERLEAETVEVLAEYDDWGNPCFVSQPSEIHAEAAAALRDLTAFVQSVSDVPLEDIELEYTAANILHGRGALMKGVKTEGVIAVKTLRAILRAARDRLPSAPNQAKEAGE